MNKYLKIDPWCIIEDKFDAANHQSSESIFSIGNGRMGQRANFEEDYSGEMLQGTYIAGVYYPDKTKVGWWKNGYPEYFAKVLNAPNFTGIKIQLDDETLDLAKVKVLEFKRTLNMKEGTLNREFSVEIKSGKQFQIKTSRILSMDMPETGLIQYEIIPINATASITMTSFLDSNVKNEDANWEETFWNDIHSESGKDEGFLVSRTKKTEFEVCIGMHNKLYINNTKKTINSKSEKASNYVSCTYNVEIEKNNSLKIEKFICSLSSLYHSKETILENAKDSLAKAISTDANYMLENHLAKWSDIWEHSDIIIEGDDDAQQAIRFNIFQLNQTYTGDDERLNVGPKGFTGEKYGGTTYWDTEAYCLPFFLCTAPKEVSRNLLLYRYKHLEKAIENGKKLGFSKGAALFPMVTINGEECHNEWEITFEEIHRNGAIAFAVYNYIRHTEDNQYLIDYGLELLIGISRFWAQRISYSQDKKKYVMLGVTGPNEYENNVNNNWYTNTFATWTLKYTIEVLEQVKELEQSAYYQLLSKLDFNSEKEVAHWQDIISNMHYPKMEQEDIFLQQDGYLDKEQITVDQLDPIHRPLNQKWSWDRILRSCFIKQADVLQGIYLFEDNYSLETIRKNFDFYESRTVHESSLSPCVHSILAAKLGDMEKAYELYLRTSRLDIDDYNAEVSEGCHITSMAGTWMSVVEGFGGKRIKDGKLSLSPQIPVQWKSYSFKIMYRGSLLNIQVSADQTEVTNETEVAAKIQVFNNEYTIKPFGKETIKQL